MFKNYMLVENLYHDGMEHYTPTISTICIWE